MSAHEDVQRIIEVAKNLAPREVSAEVSLMTGARIKAWAPKPAPARSAEHGLPMSDSIDRWYRAKLASYHHNIAAALRSLERAAFEQSEIMLGRGNTELMHDEHGAPTEAALRAVERETSPRSGTCANCKRVVEGPPSDRLLSGRCRTCYEYRRRNDVDRPKELWEAAA
jgi:hypothetical protein